MRKSWSITAKISGIYKEVWQLRKLRAMGVNGLSIGTESGDDDTLALAGKGYMADDILKQCRKLDEAGIEYYFVYMTGLAGKRDCGSYRCLFRICRSGHICLPILPQIFIHYLFISQKKGKAPFQSCNL